MDITQVEKANQEIAELRAQRDRDYAEYEAAGRIWGLVPRERITKIKFPRVKKEIIDGYLSMEDMSTTVSDVLDGYGIDGAIPTSYLKPVIPGSKICGPAVTIRNIPVRKTPTQGAHDHDSSPCPPGISTTSASRATYWCPTSGATWRCPTWAARAARWAKSCGFGGQHCQRLLPGCLVHPRNGLPCILLRHHPDHRKVPYGVH